MVKGCIDLLQVVKTLMTMIAQITFPIATIQNMLGCQKFVKEHVDIAMRVNFLIDSFVSWLLVVV